MKCPNCGAAELVRDTRNMRYVYKGETAVFEAVTGDYCPACDEAVLDIDEATRTGQMMLAFNKEVNASQVDPAFIAAVRKKLDLDQREAAEIFGGGGERLFALRKWQDPAAARSNQTVESAGPASGAAGRSQGELSVAIRIVGLYGNALGFLGE